MLLFDGNGHIAHGKLLRNDADDTTARRSKRRGGSAGARVEIAHVLSSEREARRLTLIVGACKGQRLDWLVEKCTELGVTRLELARFERTVVKPGDVRVGKLDRTAIEACRQSERAWLPEITAGRPLSEIVEDLGDAALLVADPDEAGLPLATWLHGHPKAAANLACVIGPEGGISPVEIALLRERGAVFIRLAENILRVETAAIAVAANWAARGDMRGK
jgi:16S rRNA (uracil1498-N3)-methyltransferase